METGSKKCHLSHFTLNTIEQLASRSKFEPRIFQCRSDNLLTVWQSKPLTIFCRRYCRLLSSEGVTDLLASFDLFRYLGRRKLPFLTFSLSDHKGQCHHRRQVCSFLKMWILFVCHNLSSKKCSWTLNWRMQLLPHVGGPNSTSGKCFVLKSRYVIGLCWLHDDSG
jgi:hypothetical protein